VETPGQFASISARLKWCDVDLEKSTATVRRALIWNRRGGGFVFEKPKTQHSIRTISLPLSLTAKLRKHRLTQAEYRLSLGTAYENLDLVFASEVGRPIHFRNLSQRYYVQILQKAGLDKEGFVLYSLRHGCATLLLAANTHPKVVSERLGHSSIKITLDTYSHVLPTMQQEASDKLESMLYSTG
jgi:integrase